MNLSVNLQVRQSQTLAMTPQLLQSIRLLQFHHTELQSFLDREAAGNPLIEVRPGAGDPLAAAAPEAPDAAPGAAGPERAADLPTFGLPRSGASSDRANGVPIEDLAGHEIASLPAHALGEIDEVFADPAERRLARTAFADLIEAGYLAEPDLAAVAARLGVDVPHLETLLARLQREAEPAGLFARSLSECLAIQLARRDRLDPVMRCVLDHLPLLARRDFAALARLTGEDEAGLADILREIRALDPRPGAGLGSAAAPGIVPDVVVREGADGGFAVELNGEAFPRLLVHDSYRCEVGGPADAEGRRFLGECRQSASWLLRSLEQRARTVLKVATEIVRRQDLFLAQGPSALRPMTLQQVAETVGLHESTVSRVTANKFIATPRGTFEMRFFFTVAIQASDGGDAHSAESVKLRVRALIAAETVGGVLSDDDIAARLRGEGIELARRTVAKYREALGLPSSVQRRRELNARRLAG